MARSYKLKRRAERQAETRRRIVDATIELHGTVGPGRTTVSMVADRAGVQRHTVYAHFPDEWDLHLACSGDHLARDPLPEPAAWRQIDDPGQRLRAALRDVYAWYARNAGLAACVLRDAEWNETTARIVELRMAPVMRDWHATLGEGRGAAGRALLHLALTFHTWRSLTQTGGLDPHAAAEAMARAVETA